MVWFRLADGLWLEGRGAGEACGHALGQDALRPYILPSLYSSAGGTWQWVLAMLQLWPCWRRLCTREAARPHLLPVQQAMASLGAGMGHGDPSLGQTLLQVSGSRELSPVGPGCASPSLHLSGDPIAPRSPACCTDIAHKGFNGHYCNLWLCRAFCRDGGEMGYVTELYLCAQVPWVCDTWEPLWWG